MEGLGELPQILSLSFIIWWFEMNQITKHLK